MGNRQQRARKANGILHVPLDCKTLKHALNRAKKKRQYHTISIGKGEHQLEKILKKTSQEHNYLSIDFPIRLVGNGDKTEVVVVGGFWIREGVQGNVHIQNMTIRHLNDDGVWGKSPFTLEDVIVEKCGSSGVRASGDDCVARCTNVEVRQCRDGGVVAWNGGSITLTGAKTAVHHNCTSGSSCDFGFEVYGAASKIQLVHPLTKESVATNNQGGGNWGATRGADIHRIVSNFYSKTLRRQVEQKSSNSSNSDLLATLPTFMQRQVLAFFGFKDYALVSCCGTYLQHHWVQAVERRLVPLSIPIDCKSLNAAVAIAKSDPRICTISVRPGEHQVKASVGTTKKSTNYLKIDFPITIVGNGDPNEVVVVGGVYIEKGAQGNVHVQNMTVRHLSGTVGVWGQSPFTLEDVIVEQCQYGVLASGTACVARCTNVEVRQCKWSGVCAREGGSITLMGAKTTVHHNCTSEESWNFGLFVSGASSKIQMVHPLTKESVATDNQGGGDWGVVDGAAINDIQTIPRTTT